MKQEAQNDMKRVSVNVDQMQAFVIVNSKQLWNDDKYRSKVKN